MNALIEKPTDDSLTVEVTTIQFECFLCVKGLTPEERGRCVQRLGQVSIAPSAVQAQELVVEELGPMTAEDIVPEDEPMFQLIPSSGRRDMRM